MSLYAVAKHTHALHDLGTISVALLNNFNGVFQSSLRVYVLYVYNKHIVIRRECLIVIVCMLPIFFLVIIRMIMEMIFGNIIQKPIDGKYNIRSAKTVATGKKILLAGKKNIMPKMIGYKITLRFDSSSLFLL
jgi:hypothetical protein